MIDEHDQRKHGSGGIEARMIDGETVPRVSQAIAPTPETVERIRKTFNRPDKVLNHSLAHKCANELEKSLADSALKTVRILELEKELAAALDSLRGLHDEQNGAPTFRRQENWLFEMARAESLLLKHNK